MQQMKPPFVMPETGSIARPTARLRELRFWADTFHSTQRFRVGQGNRLSAFGRQMDTAAATIIPQAKDMSELTDDLEQLAEREMRRILQQMPIWTAWLGHVKGLDARLGGVLLSLLLPPLPGRSVATWYKAAGLDPVRSDHGLVSDMRLVSDTRLGSDRPLASDDGVVSDKQLASDRAVGSDTPLASEKMLVSDKPLVSDEQLVSENVVASEEGMGSDMALASEKRLVSDKGMASKQHPAATDPTAPHLRRYQAGQTPTWYPRLRKTLYLVGESFVRVGGYYQAFYREWKAAYAVKHPTKPPWVIDRIARWRTVKLLLSHCWLEWCEIDGIPCGPPYAIGLLGHAAEHYRQPPRPADYGGRKM